MLGDAARFENLKSFDAGPILRFHRGNREAPRYDGFHVSTRTGLRKTGGLALGNVVNCAAEGLGRGEAIVEFLLEGGFDNERHIGRHVGVGLKQRGNWLTDVLVGDRYGGISVERRLSREQLIHHNTQGIEVSPCVGFIPAGLFGGNIECRSQNRGGLFEVGCGVRDCPGNTKVHHFDAAVFGDHDVCRFDIAVHDTRFVGHLEGGENAVGDLQDVALFESTLAHNVAEQVTIDVLHDDIRGGAPGRAGVLGTVWLISRVEHPDNGGV